jgi:hypothetical protein
MSAAVSLVTGDFWLKVGARAAGLDMTVNAVQERRKTLYASHLKCFFNLPDDGNKFPYDSIHCLIRQSSERFSNESLTQGDHLCRFDDRRFGQASLFLLIQTQGIIVGCRSFETCEVIARRIASGEELLKPSELITRPGRCL